MTWNFDATGETVDLYDPDGNLVSESVEFSGAWSEYPQAELRDEVASHLTSDAPASTEQAVLWAFQWLAGDVQEGIP